MKILPTAFIAALAAVTLVPSAAMARDHDHGRWRNGGHHNWNGHNDNWRRHCWYTWRHHHRVRVCR